MIIDERGKLFGKISFIDLTVLVIIVFAIIAFIYKTSVSESAGPGSRITYDVEYVLRVKGIRSTSVEAFEQSYTEINDAENKKDIGQIMSYYTEPATDLVQKNNGEKVLATIPERYDLYVTIKGEGEQKNEGIYLRSGKKVSYGTTIGINTLLVQMFGEVVDFNVSQ